MFLKAPPCIIAGCGKPSSVQKTNNNGTPKYRSLCSKHHRNRTNLKNYKKDYCENQDGHLGFPCTATIIDPCQIQVDHVDGDRYNGAPDNLKSYCGNCHAVKTKRNNDHLNRYDHVVKTTEDELFEEEK